MEDQTFLFKVILIGNSGVGKTCLARRFIQGEFPVNKGATIGVDFMIKPMMVNGKFVFILLNYPPTKISRLPSLMNNLQM